MSLRSDFERYTNYKLFRMCDKIIENHIKEKRIKKEYKKRIKENKKSIVEKYGLRFYYQEQRWNRVKDQLKNETFPHWQNRVKIYGFTLNSVDIKTGEKHLTKALTNTGKIFHESNLTVKDYQDLNREKKVMTTNKSVLPTTADFKLYTKRNR
jgi:phosphoenolpyruvate carboxylase